MLCAQHDNGKWQAYRLLQLLHEHSDRSLRDSLATLKGTNREEKLAPHHCPANRLDQRAGRERRPASRQDIVVSRSDGGGTTADGPAPYPPSGTACSGATTGIGAVHGSSRNRSTWSGTVRSGRGGGD